ncbi:uncharacterized protein LOC110831370 isoform X2 [Zootermopsis nevadensis]|uniref:uncharacterized protein LOC110831370 isoform X2 n=1 Tax=Zootermopsis nevadensis TaxID=136037 RepID=UPI000B8E4C3A|nr:uncharacterized protein LOC110831370 isoform X2 [Zootermopsis nevadensis]
MIELEDGLPPVVCKTCTDLVNRVDHFIKVWRFSDNILRDLFQKYRISLIHTPLQDKTHARENQSNLSESSDCSVSSKGSNLLHQKPEDRSSSGNTPATIDCSDSSTGTHTSKNVQEKYQTDSVQEPLYSATVLPILGHASKNISKIHSPVPLVKSSLKYSETEDDKSDSTISNTLDGIRDCAVVTYDKYSNNVNTVSKPFNNTENGKQIYNSKGEKKNLNCGQAIIHDIGNKSVCISENNTTLNKHKLLFQMLAKNHTDSYKTSNDKDIVCGTTLVENTKFPIIKVNSSTINSFPKSIPNTGSSHKSAFPLSSSNIQPSEEFTDGVIPDVQKSNQPSYIAPDSVENMDKCASKVMTASLPEIGINTSNIGAMFNISQHKSGLPPVPLAVLTELVKDVQSYMPKSVGPVASVNKSSEFIMLGLDNSCDGKEHTAIEMRGPPEQQIPHRTPTVHKHGTPSSIVESTYTSGENYSLSTLPASNPPSKIMTTVSVLQDKPSPTITDNISMNEMLLSPSKVTDVIRTVGSKFGIFLENDDTVGNVSQVPEYPASRIVLTYETPDCSIPQFGGNCTIPYQTSGPSSLQAQSNVTCSTGQGVQVAMLDTNQIPLNTDINNQPLTSLPPPQANFTQVMASTNCTHRAPNFAPNDYQRISSRHITLVSKPIEQRKRVSEECSSGTKQRKNGPRNKFPTSKRRRKEAKLGYLLEENLRSLLASIKAALPSTGMIPTQENLQSTLKNPNDKKQLGVAKTVISQELETNNRSIGKQQHCNKSAGVEKDEAQQQVSTEGRDTEILNKLHSFRIKITKTDGKYRSSSVQNTHSHHDPHFLSTPDNSLLQNYAFEKRPFIRISQLKPYQLSPFVVVKTLKNFFVPDVTYRLTDAHVTNLLDEK